MKRSLTKITTAVDFVTAQFTNNTKMMPTVSAHRLGNPGGITRWRLLLLACIAAALASACGRSPERTLARLDASMAKGDYRAAAIDAQTLIQSDPKNIAYRIRFADALLGSHSYPEAAIELRKA